MSFTLDNPFQYWNNPNNSNPVGLGRLYVGLPDTDPEQVSNRVTVKAVQPDGSELAISQPVQLLAGGIPSYNGSPVQLKIDAETVSVKVTTSNGAQSYYTSRWSVPSKGMLTEAFLTELASSNSTVVIAGLTAADIISRISSMRTPEEFEASPSSPNSTEQLQNAIDALPAFGILDGGGKEYNVRTLLLKSNITLRNIRFKTIAGNIDFVSPITILGETTPIWIDGELRDDYLKGSKTNINLVRVTVNGNRQNQTAIDASREDGGRHGVRALGRVTNLTLDSCALENCGTDGIQLFSNNSLPTTENVDALCFANITLINCRIAQNRRHGITVDSAFNVKVINTDSRRNGLDLDTTSPLNSGMRGARFAGNLYGRPYDFEGYGIGSRIVSVEIRGGNHTGNAAGALFYDNADVNNPNFLPRQGIVISDVTLDATIETAGQPDFALAFYSTTSTTIKQGYEDIVISNCILNSWINIDGVKGINIVGGSAKAKFAADSFFARIVNSKKWFLRGILTDKPAITAAPSLPFEPVWVDVIGTPVFSSQAFTLAGFTSNGWLCKYNSVYTMAATGSYFGRLEVPNCKLIPVSACGTIQASGFIYPVCQSTSGNNISVPYNATVTTPQDMELIFEVVPI